MKVLRASSPANIIVERGGVLFRIRPGRGDQEIPPEFNLASMLPVVDMNGHLFPEVPNNAKFDLQPLFATPNWTWQLVPVGFDTTWPFKIIMANGTGPADMAVVENLLHYFPPRLLAEAKLDTLEIQPSPQAVQRRADEIEHEGMIGVRGFYDAKKRMIVVALRSLTDPDASGMTLYHELWHSVEYLVTPEEIEQVRGEWPTYRENHLAYAGGQYLSQYRAGTLVTYRSLYPKSSAVFDSLMERWG